MQKPPDNEQPTTPQREIIYVQSPPYPYPPEEDEINLLDLWLIIWRGKWFIMGFTLLCTLVAVYVSLYVLPVTYKSDVVLEPINIDMNPMLENTVFFNNLPIPVSLPKGGNKSRIIIAFLNSRNLKARLITKYNLLPRLYNDLWNSEKQKWKIEIDDEKAMVVKALQESTLNESLQVTQDNKTSLITVSWVDEDPVFAKEMLNRVVEELKNYLDNEYESDTKREKEFVENQLEQVGNELKYWEQQVPSKDLPLARIQREQIAAQTVYAELKKQLELSKIYEAKKLVSFKVLDEPFVPEKKYKPKRSLICLVTMITAGFFSVFFVFLVNFIRQFKKNKD
jgi:uncharacterized protein involved in exopolysaccharide biosynthesis